MEQKFRVLENNLLEQSFIGVQDMNCSWAFLMEISMKFQWE